MDTSRAPMGERQRRAILDAIRQDGDIHEKHFLEVKSTFDLDSMDDCAKVAKFILGAANRSVELANRAFGGYAVMVLGAEKGRVAGVPAGIEVLALDQKIAKYLGAESPQWDLERHPADETGAEALFIVVDPPKQGDQIFWCRKGYDGSNASTTLRDGEIYVRTQGQTRKTQSADLDRLMARATQRTATLPEFEVSLDGHANLLLPSEDFRDKIAEQRIQQAREKYVKVQSDSFPNPTLNALVGSHPLFGGTELTSESFEERAEKWEDDLAVKWSSIMDELAGATLSGPVLSIQNAQDQFLEAVRVDIFFENARGIDHTDIEGLDKNKLIPPVIRTGDPYGLGVIQPSFLTGLRPASGTYPLTWKNETGGLRVIIELSELRPGTPWASDNDDFVLVANSAAVTAHWRIPACQGELRPVAHSNSV